MVIILMGVSGSGKTTIGRKLADAIAGIFQDGDWFHPSNNIAKMSRGEPLNDKDRAPWLDILSNAIAHWCREARPYIVACSALKQEYRDILSRGRSDVKFVYLKGSRLLVQQRLGMRHNHFMPSALLDSQFAALEEPQGVLVVDIAQTPDAIVAEIIERMDETCLGFKS